MADATFLAILHLAGWAFLGGSFMTKVHRIAVLWLHEFLFGLLPRFGHALHLLIVALLGVIRDFNFLTAFAFALHFGRIVHRRIARIHRSGLIHFGLLPGPFRFLLLLLCKGRTRPAGQEDYNKERY